MMNKLQRYTKHLLLTGSIAIMLSFQSDFFEIAKQIEIYTELFKELNMYYVNEINPAELTTKAINNTLKDLDPYTNYFNEQDVEAAKIRQEGEYAGVGISAYYDAKGITISEVYKGYPADKKNLKAGDIIVEVDGQSLKNLANEQLSEFLKGAPNTDVKVVVDRQGKLFNTTLTREKISVSSVPFYEMLDETTGYIILTRFSNKASSEVKKAFEALKEKGMQALVLDLRGNPGGSLLEALNISNFFLPKGSVIVTTKAKVKKWSNTYRATNDPLDLEIPIAVLVDDRSASASEIVSGSLQDYDRALIIGQRSFGKGLVQRYRELSYGTQLKVTISKYYTPSGRCIQELDYANRAKDGSVPKFSDRGINEFTTQNGRKVYDGGGVTPDIVVSLSNRLETTDALLDSRAIFNFASTYTFSNAKPEQLSGLSFPKSLFSSFLKFAASDTTFVTPDELRFEKAYEELSNQQVLEEEKKAIQKKLTAYKIRQISTNEDRIVQKLKEQITQNYFYKEGVYQYKVQHDEEVKKALSLLKDPSQYNQILGVN